MPSLDTSAKVEHWLRSIGARVKRQAKEGTLFTRDCPNCGQSCRIQVPRAKRHITPGTLSSIFRQAHVDVHGNVLCERARGKRV